MREATKSFIEQRQYDSTAKASGKVQETSKRSHGENRAPDKEVHLELHEKRRTALISSFHNETSKNVWIIENTRNDYFCLMSIATKFALHPGVYHSQRSLPSSIFVVAEISFSEILIFGRSPYRSQ